MRLTGTFMAPLLGLALVLLALSRHVAADAEHDFEGAWVAEELPHPADTSLLVNEDNWHLVPDATLLTEPYSSAVRIKLCSRNNEMCFRCSGTLIAWHAVLTNAHCMYHKDSKTNVVTELTHGWVSPGAGEQLFNQDGLDFLPFGRYTFRESGLHWNPVFNIAIGAGTNDLAIIILDEPVQADTSGNYDNPQITPRTVVGAKDSASKNVDGVKMLSYPIASNEQYGWDPLSTSRMHESDGDLTIEKLWAEGDKYGRQAWHNLNSLGGSSGSGILHNGGTGWVLRAVHWGFHHRTALTRGQAMPMDCDTTGWIHDVLSANQEDTGTPRSYCHSQTDNYCALQQC